MIEFKIPYPKKKTDWTKEYGMNRLYAGKHWSKRQADASYWHLLVRSEMNAQGIPPEPLVQPVAIEMLWNDRLDLDNHYYMAKMIVDAMCGDIIKDDSRKYVQKITHSWTDEDAVIVRVTEV